MATVEQEAPPPEFPRELHSGDRMTRAEFHRIYETMPEDFRAELIGGTVYVAPPLKRRHATNRIRLGAVFTLYEAQTPGVEVGDNVTVILSEEDEPQPDLYLRILPEYGGQTHDTEDEYIGDGPELLAEVAYSSRSIDLHAKKDQYAQYGVVEYVVVLLHEKRVRWFDLRTNQEFAPDAEGVFRSQVFPGLWLHSGALLAKDYPRLLATLEQGLATEDHAAFVRRLAAAQRSQGTAGGSESAQS